MINEMTITVNITISTYTNIWIAECNERESGANYVIRPSHVATGSAIIVATIIPPLSSFCDENCNHERCSKTYNFSLPQF